MKALLASLLLLAPPAWSAPAASLDPWSQAYASLESALGPEAVKVLSDSGVVVVAPSKPTRSLLHVQWEVLETLVRHGHALGELAAQAEAFKSKGEVSAVEEGLRGLLELPPIGPFTPGARAAASMLVEARVHRQALGLRFGTAGTKLLWGSSWAEPFGRRFHAASLEDPGPILEPYFETMLSGPQRVPEAAEHFSRYVKEAYKTDISKTLDRGLAMGELSAELRGWLARYLLDQRRLARLESLSAAFSSLYGSDLRRGLKDLAAAAAALEKAPGLVAALRPKLSSPEAPCSVCLRTTEAHLHTPAPGGRHELGDKAEVSSAYWVDGLPERESTDVSEVWFQDRGPLGLTGISLRVVSRRNGGPYTTSAETVLKDASPFAWRLILSLPRSAPARREVQVKPGREVSDALAVLARADNDFLSCRLEEARDAYDRLEESWTQTGPKRLGGHGKVLHSRLEKAEKAIPLLKKLKDLMPMVRRDAAPEHCSFRTDRAEEARRLLAALPSGCSRTAGPEANALLLAAAGRRAAQDAFDKAREEAASAERSCRLSEAVERWAGALSLLDAEPAARCGLWERAHKDVRETDLPRASAAAALPAHIEETLVTAGQATASADHHRVLESLLPLLSRIDASPSPRCHAAQRRKAEDLAAASGAALGDTEGTAFARLSDPVEGTIADVAAHKGRFDRNFDERQAWEKEMRGRTPSSPAGNEAVRGTGSVVPSAPVPVREASLPKKSPAPKKAAAVKTPKKSKKPKKRSAPAR